MRDALSGQELAPGRHLGPGEVQLQVFEVQKSVLLMRCPPTSLLILVPPLRPRGGESPSGYLSMRVLFSQSIHHGRGYALPFMRLVCFDPTHMHLVTSVLVLDVTNRFARMQSLQLVGISF